MERRNSLYFLNRPPPFSVLFIMSTKIQSRAQLLLLQCAQLGSNLVWRV